MNTRFFAVSWEKKKESLHKIESTLYDLGRNLLDSQRRSDCELLHAGLPVSESYAWRKLSDDTLVSAEEIDGAERDR